MKRTSSVFFCVGSIWHFRTVTTIIKAFIAGSQFVYQIVLFSFFVVIEIFENCRLWNLHPSLSVKIVRNNVLNAGRDSDQMGDNLVGFLVMTMKL